MPDPDATPVQLDESEEARKPKHKALPHNVIKEVYDAHQLTHLPFRSWCDHCVKGKAVDDAHRPRIDPHKGKAKIGMNYFFLARATDPHHAKSVRNGLDFQSGAVFSAVVVKEGDPYAQAVALEAIKFTGRTRLIIMCDEENAVNNLVDRSGTAELMKLPSPTHRQGQAPVLMESNGQIVRSRNRHAP